MVQNGLCVLFKRLISSYKFRNDIPSICNLETERMEGLSRITARITTGFSFYYTGQYFNNLPVDQYLRYFEAKTFKSGLQFSMIVVWIV